MARVQFGMSARDVLHDTPEWELDVLIEKWNDEQRERAREADKLKHGRR